MQVFSNFARTYLSVSVDDTATVLTCAATDGGLFQTPEANDYELLILTDGTYWEIIKVNTRVGDVFTVERGYEGVARSWGAGTVMKSTVTQATLDEFIQRNQLGASINLFAYQNYK